MHPKLFDGFNCESKGENNGRKMSWGSLLGSKHFGVERHAKVSGWRLGRVISKLITHTNMYKPNNELVSA
jgi:hypothetical protein